MVRLPTPAKAPALSTPEEYQAIGVPEEWIEPLQKLGYTTIDKLKEAEKPGKLATTSTGTKRRTSWICLG